MHFEGQRPNTGIKEAPKHLNTLICRNLKSIKKLYDDILMRERERKETCIIMKKDRFAWTFKVLAFLFLINITRDTLKIQNSDRSYTLHKFWWEISGKADLSDEACYSTVVYMGDRDCRTIHSEVTRAKNKILKKVHVFKAFWENGKESPVNNAITPGSLKNNNN